MSNPKRMTLPSDQDATGRTLGTEEIDAVAEAIRTGTLTVTKGTFAKTFERRFAESIGSKVGYACSSGTAAIHCAVAAINPDPGDEIVTTPTTDMGALTPIVYQGAIPVFADVDPLTCNVTAKTIEARLSKKTKAIIVTHLFGNPCEMDDIVALGKSRGIPIIEDCAQAFGARWGGRPVGTIGTIGCFSLQQGKHITTGEGGMVVTDDEALGKRMYFFINKAWGYGEPNADHYFLALNYRMSELQGACALAQLGKLEGSVSSRVAMANRLTPKIAGLPGITAPWTHARSVHTYWKYCLRVDPKVVPDGPAGLARLLKDRGIASAPRYINKPAFACMVFRDQKTFGESRWPFTLARPEAVDYSREQFPGAWDGLDGILVLPWNERYTDEHVDYIADSLHECYAEIAGGKR